MASILKYFLLGVIAVILIYPVLDSLAAVVITWLEMVKGKMSVQITEYNCQISKLTSEAQLDTSSTHAIGFAVPNYEEDENEDESI